MKPIRIKATIFFIGSFLFGGIAFAQQTVVNVSVGNVLGFLCQKSEPQTASCLESWSFPELGQQGGGSADATANFGLLQGFVNDGVTVTTPGGAGQTFSLVSAFFQDSLSFPNLTTSAFLQGTVTLSGTASKEPASMNTQLDIISGFTGVECNFQTIKGSCTAKLAVSPGDFVNIYGNFGISAQAYVPAGATGADDILLDYVNGKGKKEGGAKFSFVVVDDRGRPLKNVNIVAASGTVYPTK